MVMYRHAKTVISVFFLICFLAACRQNGGNGSIAGADAVTRCAELFRAEDFTCLIAEDGRIKHEYAAVSGREKSVSSAGQIRRHFMAPLVLRRMIKDSLLRERDSVTFRLKVKSLLFTPAEYYDTGDRKRDAMTDRIMTLIQNKGRGCSYSVSAGFPGKLQLSDAMVMPALLRDLYHISEYFDRTYPEYSFSSKAIYNVFPSWYTQGLSGFFGWKIMKFQGQTVLWNYFDDGRHAVLALKFMEQKLFAAFGYTTGRMPSPDDLNKDDLLQSPLALALFRAVYLAGKPVDYRQTEGSLYDMLVRIRSSPYNFIYFHEMQACARLYREEGDAAQASVLDRVMGRLVNDPVLMRYKDKPALAQISYVSDQLRATVPFALQQTTGIQVLAEGQVKPPQDYTGNTWQFDNVQIFINDHAGEAGNSWLNTHLFQFNYASDTVRESKGRCATGDPSDTSYLVEAAIQWKTLNARPHGAGREILANVFVGDCDLEEDRRKSVLSWAVAPGDDFGNEKKYGHIVLSDRPARSGGKTLYAVRTQRPPSIDGKEDPVWREADWSCVALPYIGSTSRPDNAARFKALYDDSCLYLLFDVTDNCKNRFGIVTLDKCWIEDVATGLPVYKMNGSMTPGFPGFSERKCISLPKGRYLLKYASDRGYSYENWYGRPPFHALYGVALYKTDD